MSKFITDWDEITKKYDMHNHAATYSAPAVRYQDLYYNPLRKHDELKGLNPNEAFKRKKERDE